MGRAPGWRAGREHGDRDPGPRTRKSCAVGLAGRRARDRGGGRRLSAWTRPAPTELPPPRRPGQRSGTATEPGAHGPSVPSSTGLRFGPKLSNAMARALHRHIMMERERKRQGEPGSKREDTRFGAPRSPR